MAQHICSNCAFVSPAEFRYCGQCGAHLVAEPYERLVKPRSESAARVERRQLTVLFCDLVDSTELSQSLDPEDLRKVIRAYQRACEPVIEQYGGFVSRFLGDGILAFFGYPHASEDDAKQAVHAGLGIVDSINSVDWTSLCGHPLSIAVRIGISTGIVVAGDLIGKDAAEEEAVIGETPNLAARLQSLARPNTVLLASRTRRLVAEQFVLTSLGEHTLKGFAQPVDVWRAESSTDSPTRFEAKWAAGVTPLVNRSAEMKFLTDRWEMSKQGKCQVVLICGEAGIGKSRLTEALREYAAHEPYYHLSYQCSPYHVSTALYPIMMQYQRAAGIAQYDSNIVKRERLRELISSTDVEQEHVLSAMSALLSIPNAPDDEFELLRAVAKKSAIINALFEQIVFMSRSRPLLAVVEDIHWSDPSTIELIERFSQEKPDARIMILLTCRTGGALLGGALLNAEKTQLSRLDSEHSIDLIREVASGAILPPGLAERIAAKADGIPLFAEELIKTLLTDAQQDMSGDRLTDIIRESEIPETLHDLLMARLDQLGSGKRIAQIAAVVGRQFSYELVERVADVSEVEVREGFDLLIKAGLVAADGYLPEATFIFKHALIRDTAYSSVLREERREIHKRIAAELEAGKALASPELLARHYAEAGLQRQAIDNWLLAGQAASQRSALQEAASQFRSGLQLVRNQTPGRQRDSKILEYLINLGPVVIATRGSGSSEAERVYQEAVELTKLLPESENHFIALWGWWRISINYQSEAERAIRLQELQDMADRLGDDGLTLQAHHCQWAIHFHQGNHSSCLQHINAGVEIYADKDYRSHAAQYGGHDSRVCALGEAAQSLWLTGYPDKALASMRRARLWADELKQSGSLVHVMDMNLLLLRYRREPELAAEQAKELIEFAQENEFPEYIAKAEAFRGWSLTKCENSIDGIRILCNSIRLCDSIEDEHVWLEMLADAYIDSGAYQLGLDAIDQAILRTEQSGVRFWDAELHRSRGELFGRMGPEFKGRACECYEKAIVTSAKQGARTLQLRANLSLMRCSVGSDNELDARSRLRFIIDQFDESVDMPDLVAARAIVDEYIES